MKKYNTNSNKSDGFTTSPVTVELNGRSIEAVHHFTNETDTLLNLYIDTREGGIDVVMPLASDKPAYALSERGEEVLGFTEDTHDRVDENADHELVTDGGCDIARSTGIAIERTDCNQCGDLLFDTAILFTVRTVPPTWALESDWSDWHTVTAPSAQCGTCSARVRSIAVVAAVWRARSRPLTYDTDESDDPNADRELMTDGGEPIDNESDESGNVSKDDFEGVDIEGASNEVNETHDRDENDDADDGADDNGDWDVGDMDLSFPPESDDTHDRVEYAEHPPVDLPGAGPYTPAFTDVDVTPVGDGDE